MHPAPRVLCLLAPGFEELELVAPVDLLRRAGAEVVMASVIDSIHVTGRNNLTLHADTTLAQAGTEGFDMLLIPGGPGVSSLRGDDRAAGLAKAFSAAGSAVAAICAAPLVLHDAGLLRGRRFTAHDSVRGTLPEARFEERVVEDGNLITSRGAGTAVEFGLALVRRLCGAAKSEEVARSIMA